MPVSRDEAPVVGFRHGALPIKEDGAVIGGVACSGASDEIDLACAEAALAALGPVS